MIVTDISLVREHLLDGVVEVKFKKADGSIRTMQCTQAEYLLPPTTKKSNHPQGETIIVYDLDSEGWRSFRIDRFIEAELI